MSNVEWKVLKSNADAERAQLNKILADIRSSLYSGGNGVGGPGTTNNTTVTRNFEDRLNALAMAWRDTSSRVLYYDNTIESIAQDITYLNARIDDIEVGGGDSEAIQILTARVIATEEGIIANSEFITELNAAVFDPDTGEVTWAGALEELTVTVNGIEGTVLSMYSLELDANGYVVGWKFANDGSTGVVDFRADRFRITAPGSMKSVEFADGMLMSETGTHSYYHGVDFGTANNLITWFGPTPTMGPTGANPNNGLFWIKSDGSGYFGGGLSNTVVENLPIIQQIIVNITDLDGIVESVVQQANSIESAIFDPVTGLNTRASIQELNQVKSRLDNTGGGLSIESVASTVSTLNSAVNNPTTGLNTKASNTRVAAAESRLNTAEDLLESTSSDLLTLSASIGGKGTNLIPAEYTYFPIDQRPTFGWSGLTLSLTADAFGLSPPVGTYALYSRQTSPGLFSLFYLGTSGTDYNIPVEAGKTYRASMWYRSNLFKTFRMAYREKEGGAYVVGPDVSYSTSQDWVRYSWDFTVREGVSSILLTVYPNRHRTEDQAWFAYMTGFMLEEVTGPGTAPSTWVPGAVTNLMPDIRATADATQALSVTVSDQGGILTSQGSAITQIQNRLPTGSGLLASTAYADQVGTSARNYASGLVSAEANRITLLQSQVGDVEASVTQFSSAVAQGSGGNRLINPGFELPGLTGWTPSGTGASSLFRRYTGDPNSGEACCRIDSDGTSTTISLISDTRVPHIPGRTYRFGLFAQTIGTTPNSGASLRFCLRAYRADGSYHSTNYGTVILTTSQVNSNWQRFEGTASAGTGSGNEVAYYALQVFTSGHTSGSWAIDDCFLEPLSSAEDSAMASYGVSVNANGNVAGFKLLAGGGTSSFSVEASSFSVVNSGGGNGLTWESGTLWNRRGSYSMLAGPGLGENMLFYIGSTPTSASAARKANAIFYVDSSGTGYFAGQVLQGVLRAFNSSTTVSSSASVSTGSISSNNKQVAVKGEFNYDATQVYHGLSSNITLGGGQTAATVAVERRYGSGSWTELARRTLIGSAGVVNSTDGPSIISWTISGSVAVTDSADTRNREYRTRVLSISRQQHSVTNPGTTPALAQSQYQSIESME